MAWKAGWGAGARMCCTAVTARQAMPCPGEAAHPSRRGRGLDHAPQLQKSGRLIATRRAGTHASFSSIWSRFSWLGTPAARHGPSPLARRHSGPAKWL